MESKASKNGSDENLALFGQTNKDRGKGINKVKGKSEELSSQPGNKDLSKIKCFICHKHDHYESQFLKKKKGKGKQQQKKVATSAKNKVNEFSTKFEKDFSTISFFSTSTI
jgi:hypothetical protein